MPERSINLRWTQGMQFIGTDEDGHSLVLDISSDAGGENSGFRPMELLLISMAGCTAIDVVDILKKQRQPVQGLELRISGERATEYPKVYQKVRIEYLLRGSGLNEKAVERAIKLSEEKYCSVGIMVRQSGAEVETEYRILDDGGES